MIRRDKHYLFIAGVVLVAVLIAAYCYGRRDAPNKRDFTTESMLDGMRAFRDQNDSLRRDMRVADKAVKQARAVGAKEERRADSLEAMRVPLPQSVPDTCRGWATNLATCDQQQAALRKSLGATREALDATARLRVMEERIHRTALSRADSLTKALKREQKRDRVLGIKLPSRSTSLTVGAVLGFVLGIAVTR